MTERGFREDWEKVQALEEESSVRRYEKNVIA